jgi:hypothetical protein
MAILLMVLIALGALAIDISYMYLVKNQTQVAADAGALAGAGLLQMGIVDLVQQPARDEAVKYCSLNKAANQPMTIANNYSNILSNTNDITVGYFNYTTREYTPGIAGPSVTWPNAIQVRTRRTENSPLGPVALFLGKVIGWNTMGTSSIAIAGRPPKPGAPIVLCLDACSFGTFPVDLYFKEQDQPTTAQGLAWTNLSTTSPATDLGPNSEVARLVRGEIPLPEVCCEKIYTNNGLGEVLIELDRKFAAESAATGYWDVIVPIVGEDLTACLQNEPKGCPPGLQPTEPYLVSRYAEIRIAAVYKNPNPGIRIASIQCVGCPSTTLLGDNAALLK